MTAETTPTPAKIPIPKVYRAIANVLKDLSKLGIKKDSTNEHQKYAFRGIDDIYNTLSKLLAKHDLIIIPRCQNRGLNEHVANSGAPIFCVTIAVEYDFISAKDGSIHTAKIYGHAMDSGDKATNKALSAAYKYLCLQTFCIPTEGDNDADAKTPDLAPAAMQPNKAARPSELNDKTNAAGNEPSAQQIERRQSNARAAANLPAPAKLPGSALRVDEWRMMVIPKFIKRYAGQLLGALPEDDVAYWNEKFQPQPFPPGSSKIQPADIAFRAALTLAHKFYFPAGPAATTRTRSTTRRAPAKADEGFQEDPPTDEPNLDEHGNPV